jgi:hypothetical protein
VAAHVLHHLHRVHPVQAAEEEPAQPPRHRADPTPVQQRSTAGAGHEQPQHVGGGVRLPGRHLEGVLGHRVGEQPHQQPRLALTARYLLGKPRQVCPVQHTEQRGEVIGVLRRQGGGPPQQAEHLVPRIDSRVAAEVQHPQPLRIRHPIRGRPGRRPPQVRVIRVNAAVTDRAGREVAAIEACAADEMSARVDRSHRRLPGLAQHARLPGGLEPGGEHPVDEERHRVRRHAGRELAEQRHVLPVSAEQRVAVGQQLRADTDELGGVQPQQRLSKAGGQQPAAVDQIRFQQLHTRHGALVHRRRGSGRVYGTAAAEQGLRSCFRPWPGLNRLLPYNHRCTALPCRMVAGPVSRCAVQPH